MDVAGHTEHLSYDALGRLAATSNTLGTFRYDYLDESSAPAGVFHHARSAGLYLTHYRAYDPHLGDG